MFLRNNIVFVFDIVVFVARVLGLARDCIYI